VYAAQRRGSSFLPVPQGQELTRERGGIGELVSLRIKPKPLSPREERIKEGHVRSFPPFITGLQQGLHNFHGSFSAP
jgi:hypothetical protein